MIFLLRVFHITSVEEQGLGHSTLQRHEQGSCGPAIGFENFRMADVWKSGRSLKEGFIVGGILLGYLASYALVDAVGGWRYIYALPLLPAGVLLAGMVRSTSHYVIGIGSLRDEQW